MKFFLSSDLLLSYLCLIASEQRVTGPEGGGVEVNTVAVGVVGEKEEDEDNLIPGGSEEKAFCSRSSWRCRRVEERSRASAVRPEADRLASSALTLWRGFTSGGGRSLSLGSHAAKEDDTWFGEMPGLIEWSGSVLLLPQVAFRKSGTQETGIGRT